MNMAIVLAAVLLCGCGAVRKSGTSGPADEKDNKLKIATTIFPYYDFVRQIAGDHVELSLIVPAGMDSHSFEPTPADMRVLQEADILICNGGAMEYWLQEVLDALDASHMEVMVMMDYVEILDEELAEGMEEDGHDHDHNHELEENHLEYEPEGHADGLGQERAGHEGHEHWKVSGKDEHIWTSPANAMRLVQAISQKLEEADPGHAQIYAQNASEYLNELEELHGQFLEIMRQRKRNMILIGDKFPFRYLADAYDLEYRAAFSGCSTDTEPSAKTIAYLIEQVRQERIPVVYYLELSTRRVTEIICEESGADMALLHSCHNVTRRELESGVTYLDLMKGNVESLRRGLTQ